MDNGRGNGRATELRGAHPRGHQPAAAAGRLQRLRGRPAAGRGGARARARDWAEERISAVGELRRHASAIQRLGAVANENPPKLRTHDRFGNRVDEVEFHPAWHELLGMAVEHELHSSPWKDPRPGAHVARGAAFMCMSPGRGGDRLPDLDDLLGDPGAARTSPSWPPSGSRASSPRLRPAQRARRRRRPGALAGMGMTEKQGGTDVRANTTVAAAGERRRARAPSTS